MDDDLDPDDKDAKRYVGAKGVASYETEKRRFKKYPEARRLRGREGTHTVAVRSSCWRAPQGPRRSLSIAWWVLQYGEALLASLPRYLPGFGGR